MFAVSSSGNGACRFVSFSFLLVLGFTSACAKEAAPPTSPTPTVIVGKVTGAVAAEAPPTRFGIPQNRVLPDATVTVIGGPASGINAITRNDGHYEVTAAGTFKLRFEHPWYTTSESQQLVMDAAGIAGPTVVLLTAPWIVSGRVIDGLGNPVADAQVTVFRDSEVSFQPYAGVRTDTVGRYTFNSSEPHWDVVSLAASKPGFEGVKTVTMRCCGAAPDIGLVRIVSITPTAPTLLRIGETVAIPASVVVFDSGETRNIFVLPRSNAPSVVSVNPAANWYEMRGLSAGVATLTFDLWGAIVTTQVTVR
jgi:hypothetical protein